MAENMAPRVFPDCSARPNISGNATFSFGVGFSSKCALGQIRDDICASSVSASGSILADVSMKNFPALAEAIPAGEINNLCNGSFTLLSTPQIPSVLGEILMTTNIVNQIRKSDEHSACFQRRSLRSLWATFSRALLFLSRS